MRGLRPSGRRPLMYFTQRQPRDSGNVRIIVDLVARQRPAVHFVVVDLSGSAAWVWTRGEQVHTVELLVAAQVSEPVVAEIEVSRPLVSKLGHERVSGERNGSLKPRGTTF